MAGQELLLQQIDNTSTMLEECNDELQQIKTILQQLQKQPTGDDSKAQQQDLQKKELEVLKTRRELVYQKTMLLCKLPTLPGAPHGAAAPFHEDAFQDWANMLLVVQEEDDCLFVPDPGPGLTLPYHLRSSLYVRPCYPKIFSHLWDRTIEKGKPQLFLVTGTEGCGKSHFALYLIKRLAQKRQVVFYEYHSDLGWGTTTMKLDFQVTPARATIMREAKLMKYDDNFYNPRSWWITDDLPLKAEYHGGPTLVTIAAPEYDTFKYYNKSRHSTPPLYMPPWSLEEMQHCRERLFPEMTEAKLSERYTWFGGNIRLVTHNPDDDPQADIISQVSCSAWLNPEKIFEEMSHILHYKSPTAHILGHIMVNADFSMRYICFASPLVAELMAKSLTRSEDFARYLKNWLSDYRRMPQYREQLAAVINQLYGQYGRMAFLEGGVTCRCCQLQPPPEPPAPPTQPEDSSTESDTQVDEAFVDDDVDEDLEILTLWQKKPQSTVAEGPQPEVTDFVLPGGLQLLWDEPNMDLSSLAATYLRPRSSINAAWDAVVFHEEKTYILRYTVSPSAGIRAKPMQRLLERLGRDRCAQAQLVFVVPERLSKFPWQPWKSSTGQPLQQLPLNVKALQQCVLEMPFPPQKDTHQTTAATAAGTSSCLPTRQKQ